MNKLQNVWVVSDNVSTAAELAAGAAIMGENTALVFAGDKEVAVGVNHVYYLGDMQNESFLSYIPSITSLVKDNRPQLILTDTTKNGRIAAAAIAGSVGTSVLTDVSELTLENGAVVGKRMVYGGAATKTEKGIGDIIVACVGAGIFETGQTKPVKSFTEVSVDALGIRFVEKREKEVHTVNLAAAKKVVDVGRGLRKKENLQLAVDLAAAIGAEVGCSRPVAEDEKWMPKEAYIGVSGVMIKPDVYIGCGISGQMQHMVGVKSSKIIFAVNNDIDVPIFKECDYGIVGNITDVLPVLTKKFLEI